MTQLTERLDSFEHRLRDLDAELVELRRLAQTQEQPEPLRVAPHEEPIWETLAPEPGPDPEPQPSDFFDTPPQRVRKGSISRAFSFLAVGAVILVGGLFYQRMAHEPRISG